MEYPKNCRECQHEHDCKAWHYGDNRCKHKDAIYRATINQMNNKKEEKHHGN